MSMYYCRFNLIEREDEIILVEEDDILLKVPANQPVRILEYVGGMNVSQYIDQQYFTVSDDLKDVWEKARNTYWARHKERVGFRINPNPNTPYVYFYTAISDPERIAGIQKEKITRLIETKINHDFHRYKKTWIEFVELSGLRSFLAAGYVHWNPEHMDPDTLESMGTILKTGKAARFINGGKDNIEVFAGYLQDALYISNENMNVWISKYPSSIYTMQHDESITSCMIRTDENDVRDEYFDIYDKIPTCRIAVISQEDEYGDEIVMARALLWDEVTVNAGQEKIKIMDRIYFASNRYLSAMERWAKDNGYHRKVRQALDVHEFYPPDSMNPVILKNISVDVGFKFEPNMFRFVPYVDTFQYVKKNYTVMSSFDWGSIRLIDTDGDGDWLTYGTHDHCCECWEELDKDHFEHKGDHYCNSCRNRHFTKCELCKEYIPDRNIRLEDVDGEEMSVCEECLDDLHWCSYTHGYWHYSNTVTVTTITGDKEIVSKEAAEDEGLFYECESCGKWFHKDCLIDTDEGWYCDDCETYLDECPCCHKQYDGSKTTYNHNLHTWVCSRCKFESEIQTEENECDHDDPAQYDLWPHGHGTISFTYWEEK